MTTRPKDTMTTDTVPFTDADVRTVVARILDDLHDRDAPTVLACIERSRIDGRLDPPTFAAYVYDRAGIGAQHDAVNPLDHIDRHALTVWARNAATMTIGLAAVTSTPTRDAPPRGVALNCDDRIARRLPSWLHKLAHDVAQHRGGLAVVVDPPTSQTRRRGVFVPSTTPSVVGISIDMLDADDFEWVVAHEFGHAIDPLLDERSYADREVYADTAADAIIAGCLDTVAAVHAHLDTAPDVALEAPRPNARADDLADLFRWRDIFATADLFTPQPQKAHR